MFQKFHTDTLVGRFVKHLLAVSPVPNLHILKDNEVAIKDCLYIYRNMIIKCESSGILFVSLSENLYPSDKLYPSSGITDPSIATFKVIDYFNFEDIRNNHTFESTTNYYDGETHKFLGDYLRYVRDYQGLNLMPYYNCFTDEYVNDLGLQKVQSYKVKSLFPDDNLYPSNSLYFERNEVDSESYKLTSNQGYRIASIPIKFNTTYTIAFAGNTFVLSHFI